MEGKFVCRYPNGDFVAVDMNSGGYPYSVSPNSWNHAKFWDYQSDAEEYAKICQEEGFSVHKVSIVFEAP